MFHEKLIHKAIAMLAVTVLWAAVGSIGAMGAEPVEMKVILEYPSKMAGVGKVQVLRFVMQPGASLENLKIEWEGYCTGTKGEFTIVNHTQGTTGLHAAGGHWNDVLGEVVSIYNYGDVPAEQWIVMLHKK